MTIPPNNQSLIDWLGFTVKTNDPGLLITLLGLDPALFCAFPFGFSGYRKSLRYGLISVYYDGREEMGCHVEMTGQGCRQYEAFFHGNPWFDLFQKIRDAGGQLTRLDLALDNTDGQLSLPELLIALRQGATRSLFSEWRLIQKGVLGQADQLHGETLYLGSPKSHVLFRVYNKAQEMKVTGTWVRFEIQLRNKRAHEAIKHLLEQRAVGPVATGIINHYFAVIDPVDSNISRCPLQEWWADWLQTAEKISLGTAKEQTLVFDTMAFIKKQYAPSLAMIKQHLGSGAFKAYVTDLLDDGQERMSAKHQRVLSASIQTKPRPGGEHEQS